MKLLPQLALMLLFAAGGVHAQAVVDGAYARATVGKQANGAAYLQLSAKSDDVLLSASAPVASRVEIHTMSMEGDVMKMRSLEQLEVKGGETIAMQPGAGVHIMLMGLKQPLKAGESFPLTLNFRKAGKLKVDVSVKDIGMQGKGGEAHPHDHHHHHN